MNPQTRREIQQRLDEAGLSPNRRLGQNFLVDGNVMRLVVEAAELDPGRDVALEVGAGTGSLTRMLAERARSVVTVETDHGLVRMLGEVLAPCDNVTLLPVDVLAGKHALAPEVVAAVDRRLGEADALRLKLVANLPYAVATPVVLNLLTDRPRPDLLVFTVQKEMADRLAARPGTSDYGPASVMAAALAEVERLHELSPNVFWPKPQVRSTLVRIRPDPARYAAVGDVPLLGRVAAALFAHRRKTVVKSLELAADIEPLAGRWGELLAEADIDPGERGERIDVEHVLALFAAVRRALAE